MNVIESISRRIAAAAISFNLALMPPGGAPTEAGTTPSEPYPWCFNQNGTREQDACASAYIIPSPHDHDREGVSGVVVSLVFINGTLHRTITEVDRRGNSVLRPRDIRSDRVPGGTHLFPDRSGCIVVSIPGRSRGLNTHTVCGPS